MLVVFDGCKTKWFVSSGEEENGDGGLGRRSRDGQCRAGLRSVEKTVKGRGRRLEDEEERGGGRRAVVDEEGDREEVGGMQTFAENMEVMRWFWPVLMVVSKDRAAGEKANAGAIIKDMLRRSKGQRFGFGVS
ncbi:hypothetical protein HAX54_025096 [Datura stramonium]|uniref:Uncharacterized protein n=1 Tax=Datura stramonium TaxID=4076 RepID=A0ABS8UZ68_DATST|nr:hypothetical protein [Datura stramonium]